MAARGASLDRMRDQLETLVRAPIRTPEDAARSGEAATLLGDLLRWVERVRLLTVSDDAPRDNKRQPLVGLTLHEAARRVLTEAGEPLHARELAVRIKLGGWTHPRSASARPDQIVYQLAARLPKYPETFERVSPNTFGLRAWTDPDVPGRADAAGRS
jgi:hypothetical protein